MQFVIIHGAYGSPDGNWFPQLKEQLEDLGQQVIAPQFPVEKWSDVTAQGNGYSSSVQTLDNWLKTFEEKVLPRLNKGEKACFIGHSLGPVFILHAVQKYKLQLDSAIFVSPFLGPLEQWEFNAVNSTFYKQDFDFGLLKELIPTAYILYSDNDPYVPQSQPKEFAEKLDAALIPVRKAGHINSEVNLNEFPLVFDLCTTRLDLTLWQQYIAHRKQIFGIDLVRERPGSMAIFKPEEIFDWQIFLYQHLRHSGFATFYTGIADWDPKSKYYQDSRDAVPRIENLTRVFLVEQLSDLKRPKIREQIRLDLEAGIHVYLRQLYEVEDAIDQVEFGIWDDEYVCYVKLDQNRNAESVEINTREEDLKQARQWKAFILENATKVTSLKDVDIFARTHSDEVIYLTPDEITDEGTFKFRNLKHEGFATLYIPAVAFWNEQSAYMKEARQAAKRVGDVTRVLVVDTPQDLEQPLALKQIHDDVAAGIKIYVCSRATIQKELGIEPDFGIWDNEYVCIVNFDGSNQATHARLSSLSKDIDKANHWKQTILKHSTPITGLDALQQIHIDPS